MHVSEIKTVACLGTGTMGHGVAFLAAKAGYAVRLFGRSGASIARGLAGVDNAIALYEENGLMPKGSGPSIKARITGVTSLEEAAAGVDLVMESVAEDMAVKHEVFTAVERHAPPGAILATDTSGLSPSAISSVLERPERFAVIHFFSPAYLMPTVEVCPGPATLPSVRAVCAKWVTSLGSIPVEMEKEVQGFLINRIQYACLREACHIVEQGWASAEMVDKAIVNSLGRRYAETGPFESADLGGLEIFAGTLAQLSKSLSRDTEASRLLLDPVSRGDHGAKTGKGVYDWPGEKAAARRKAREKMLVAFMKKDMGQGFCGK
ncbi:3-hydroxybutyryl-CoA dehydrogenase [uncultured delta proteobacterium]|uniref:3-hydroxybutyryl-CoA dehydrogenase n=1 Tax=uncultured delta proteobacterium TaxID=34034 RepID=A0A212KB37_9DELT|nr:3-hydroxybutyryl-CoA dehydrogenase [uncultured delta proteobacterium]